MNLRLHFQPRCAGQGMSVLILHFYERSICSCRGGANQLCAPNWFYAAIGK